MPDTMIVERGEENISEMSNVLNKNDSYVRRQAEDIMHFYLKMKNREEMTGEG